MKTRAHIAIKIPDRSKNSMLSEIHIMTKNLPKEACNKFMGCKIISNDEVNRY